MRVRVCVCLLTVDFLRPPLQYADQSLMKSAIKTSEESWIEQQMLEDKKRATDWEATNEAIEEQVARESYLQWLQDQEKQARQVRGGGDGELQCNFKNHLYLPPVQPQAS